jgi:hypothetical protein
MPTRKTVQYVIEKPWQRAPEVMKTVVGWLITAFVAGAVFALVITGGDRAKRIEDKTAKYKAEISQTCEPKPKRGQP